MDKGGKGKKAARSRASSLSAGSSSNKASKGKTPRTASLEGEATRVAAMAAAADAKAKAHQRKMTEFIQGQEQGQHRTAQGGAGELASGPSDPGAEVAAGTATTSLPQDQGQEDAPQDGAGELMSGPSGPAAAAQAPTGAPKQVQFNTQAVVHHPQDPQGQAPKGQGGAGELGAGPSNSEAATLRRGDNRSLADQTGVIQAFLQEYKDLAGKGRQAEEEISVVEVIPPPPPQRQQQQDQQEEGGWQQYISRKNRRIGAQLEDQRQAREATPFKMPGHQSSKGYYTSTNERNRARMDHARSNKSSLVAALTPRQWEWYKQRVCLACGEDHQVRFCKTVTREQSFALVRATKNCPPGMRPLPLPQDRTSRPGQSAPDARRPAPSATVTSASAATAAAAVASTPSRPTTKRPREASGAGLPSGLTPEAKKARQFSEAVKESFTLYVREKDGSALTEERYVSLKTSFAYYVEDLIANNKDPPICGGRWTYSRAVVKIPMAGEMDLLFMRCFLDKAYLVQNGEEFNKSKGQVFVAFLRDRLEPELTGMRPEKLASFIKFYKRSMKIEGLFELKMAFKTPRGKAVHLVMDDNAAEIFARAGRQIPMAGSGFIEFEDRAKYIARIKEQERARQQPKASVLEQGLREQQVDLSAMSVDEPAEEKSAEAPRLEQQGEKQKPPSAEEVERAKELRVKVGQGAMSAWVASQTYLEETGRVLEEVAPVYRRTTSGSSWSEEVEHAKGLEVPATVDEQGEAEAADNVNANDDNDFAMFELFDSRAEGEGVNPQVAPAQGAQGVGPGAQGAQGAQSAQN